MIIHLYYSWLAQCDFNSGSYSRSELLEICVKQHIFIVLLHKAQRAEGQQALKSVSLTRTGNVMRPQTKTKAAPKYCQALDLLYPDMRVACVGYICCAYTLCIHRLSIETIMQTTKIYWCFQGINIWSCSLATRTQDELLRQRVPRVKQLLLLLPGLASEKVLAI